MWVTICFTRALLDVQTDSPTQYDIPPDPGGGDGGRGVRSNVINFDTGSSRGSLLKENGSPIPMLLPCSVSGDPTQSPPLGSGPSRGRTVVPGRHHRRGVRAPPGGLCWECQAQAGGPLDLRLSAAVLYQDPRGAEQA